MEFKNTKSQIILTLSSERATALLAECIARSTGTNLTFLLYGQVGAGKTFFARKFIQEVLSSQGLFEDVPSPTYTLIQTYETPKVDIWHADLYRLVSYEDIIELGLIDAFDSNICLVEWPEKLEKNIPLNAVKIELSHHLEEERICTLTCEDEKVMANLKLIIKKLENDI